jgi:hypothetical protein
MPSRSKLVDAAADLNEVMQLKDPAIDLKQPVGSLIEQIKEAAQLLKPEDAIKPATQDVIDELKEMDEERQEEAPTTAAPPPARSRPRAVQAAPPPQPPAEEEAEDEEPVEDEEGEAEEAAAPPAAAPVRRARRSAPTPGQVPGPTATPAPEVVPVTDGRGRRKAQAPTPPPAATAPAARMRRGQTAQTPAPAATAAKPAKAPARAAQGGNGQVAPARGGLSRKYEGSVSQRYDRILLQGGNFDELADKCNVRQGYLRQHTKQRVSSGHYRLEERNGGLEGGGYIKLIPVSEQAKERAAVTTAG